MTLAAAGQPFDPRRAAFIDIETTGLARGSGTYAFLVGVGFSDESGFLVRQYFMPDYDHEEALLDLLAGDLSNIAALISFNGLSFDWPILEARYVISRRRPPCGGLPHLDLLLLARRLWGGVLPSRSLSFLEAAALGIRRDSKDIPGHLVPQLYQGYVRWGHTRPMVGVFYHNAIDVLSLVTLMARLARVISPRFCDERDPLRDDLSLGKFFERAGLIEDALRAYEMASRRSSRPGLVSEARKRMSFLLKRLGRYDEAMQVWRAQLKGDEIYPYIELAKQLEHRLRDNAQASQVTRQAIAWVQARRVRMDPLEHRRVMAQLERRLARLAGGSG